MAQSREDFEREAAEAATKLGEDYRAAQRAEAEAHRDDAQAQPETEEEARERIAIVSATQIFGDLDTTAGADAAGTDVLAHDNEQATENVAAVDAAQDAGDEDAEGVSADQARRQSEPLSADDVQEGAEAQEAEFGTPANDGVVEDDRAPEENADQVDSDGDGVEDSKDAEPENPAAF
jgi:hypothetical protein